MRPADAQRTCLYHFPEDPNKVCGAELFGRGRSKWCPSHAAVVHAVQKSLKNASYQRAWRKRHLSLFQDRRNIYQTVRNLERYWSVKLPTVQRKRLHWALLTSFRQALDRTARKCHNILYRSAILPDGYRAVVELDYKDTRSLLDDHPGDGSCTVQVTFQRMGLRGGFPSAILSRPTALLIHHMVERVEVCGMESIDSDPRRVPWFYQGVCSRCGTAFSDDLLIPWLLQLFCYAIAWGWNGEGVAVLVRMPAVASALKAKDYLHVLHWDAGPPLFCGYAVNAWPLTCPIQLNGLEARLKRAAEEGGLPTRQANLLDGLEARVKHVAAHLSRAFNSPRLRNFKGYWLHLGVSLLDCDQIALAELIGLKTCLRVFMTKENMTRND
jgi:hypothetical protein